MRFSGNVFIKAEHSRIEAEAITGDVEITANAELVKLNQLAGNLRINVANGSIALSDIEGTAWLEATRDISVQNFAGPLNIKSHSGKIRLSNKRELHGDVIVQNEHGVTNVTLPKDIQFRLDAISQTGRVVTRGFTVLEKATDERPREGESVPLLSLHSATGRIELQAAGLALASHNPD